MKNFVDLCDAAQIFEESAETRAKAKGFKGKMKPLIQRVKSAQIGDPRRYAYQMVWPFLRDELGIEELQDQDTPIDSALIQRKLEELAEAGALPDDAGTQFEAYAAREFDDFVNRISTTKRTTSLKSHFKGQNVKSHVQVAGGGAGFTSKETAAERAARVETENKLKAQMGDSDEPEDRLGRIGISIDEIEDEFKDTVRDIADTIVQADTTLVEIHFDLADGPIVQKQQIMSLFNGNLIEQPDDVFTKSQTHNNQGIMEFELAPNSALAQQIAKVGPDRVERLLKDTIFDNTDREVEVIIHVPEEEDPIKPINDEGDDDYMDDDYEPSDRELQKLEAEIDDDDDSYVRTYMPDNGDPDEVKRLRKPNKADKDEEDDDNEEDLETVAGRYHKLKKGRNTRRPMVNESSILDYMPVSDGDYEQKTILESTKNRFKPTSHHQLEEYHRMMRG
jgi:hypothetical protein